MWFPATPEHTRADGTVVPAQGDQVKDIRSGEQVDAAPATWTPPAEDLWPVVRAAAQA